MTFSHALVIALTIIYVNSCAVDHGLVTYYGSHFAKAFLGPVNTENNQPEQNSQCCIKKYGADLSVNEEKVRNKDNYVYPCSKKDYDCMRKFLQQNSKCTPQAKPIPDPLYLKQLTLASPNANMTITLTNVSVEGLNKSEVDKFYYNKATGNLVIGIKLPFLNETSLKTYVSYERKGKEPIVLADVGIFLSYDVYFTAVIPKISNLRLELAKVHAEMPLGKPYLGPKAYTSTDPDVQEGYASFSTTVGTSQRECFLFKSQFFTALYIQNYLCNFNQKLYMV